MMNGAGPTWQEATHSDGRVYFYNTITKETTWEKPEEIMNPFEVSAPARSSQYGLHFLLLGVFKANIHAASFGQIVLERVHCRRREKVLLQ
jgi:hypothetical protein